MDNIIKLQNIINDLNFTIESMSDLIEKQQETIRKLNSENHLLSENAKSLAKELWRDRKDLFIHPEDLNFFKKNKIKF